MNSEHRLQWERYHFPQFRRDSIVHPFIQHYDAVHRLIECPECGRQFKTKKAMDQVSIPSRES